MTGVQTCALPISFIRLQDFGIIDLEQCRLIDENIQPIEVGVIGDSIDVEMRVYEGAQATIDKVMISPTLSKVTPQPP